ncbi:MAG: NAD-dependent epimerase/dehydratase family protein [Chloroflexi bacterium]|nr:NAD-dependent epimerase/dehydratase family protein [Chloroflexota bacterium]
MNRGRVLVTGGAGFVGGHLIAELAATGAEIVSIDRRPPRRPLPHGVRALTFDLREADATRAAVAEIAPERIYHLAAQSSVAVSMRDPQEDIETNVLATVTLATAAAAAGCARFVFVSSGGTVYGAAEQLPTAEDARLSPRSIYGASKAAAEQYLDVIARQRGLPVAVVRPANIYGPWQDPLGEAGVIAIFAQRMLRGEPVTIFGDGAQTRDYVFVSDVITAMRAAADAPAAATANVGTGAETSTQQIFDGLAALTGYERRAVYEPERPGDLARIVLDPAHAYEAWGWRPTVALADGLARTVAWFREGSPGA